MTAHEETKKAIYEKLTSTSTFKTLTNSRVYYGRAPQYAVFPYCVYSFYADTHSYDSGSKFETIFIQFSIFDKNNSSSGVTNIESALIDLLPNNVALNFTNFIQLGLIRLSKRYLMTEEAEQVWHTVIEYQLDIQHK
jgi:hypothetical protein